ncbi:hypothetical protein ACIQVK_53050 [Streptomyces sp. NPDC090493]|uniref:hypothetical protein n=1 Tax=Streptomyces sp. NPDC090493 TaxID=3365964 RepID=UPI003827BD51
MTFVDPSAGRHQVPLRELESWGLAWDSYDPAVHGELPIPAFYPAARVANWWGCTLSLDDLLDLAQVHGIPVAWVPDRALLRTLAAAGDHDDKVAVLVAAESKIRVLCSDRLDECTNEWVSGEVEAGRKALAAWSDGHHEAAACLALAGLEQILYRITWAKPRSHAELRRIGAEKPNGYLPARQHALAPLATLYAKYYPENGDPMPDNLSRHAVLHHLPLDHLSPGNCIIAVMLFVSIIRQYHEHAEEIRQDMIAQAAD